VIIGFSADGVDEANALTAQADGSLVAGVTIDSSAESPMSPWPAAMRNAQRRLPQPGRDVTADTLCWSILIARSWSQAEVILAVREPARQLRHVCGTPAVRPGGRA